MGDAGRPSQVTLRAGAHAPARKKRTSFGLDYALVEHRVDVRVLDRFQLQDAEALGRHAFAEVEDLDADHIVGRVVVQDHARLDFLGLYYRGLIEPQIQRIALFVHFQFHDCTQLSIRSPASQSRQDTSLDPAS